MKTTSLVVGLVQIAAAVVLCLLPYGVLTHPGSARVVLCVLVTLGACINAFYGVSKVIEALFGDGGLVFDLARYFDRHAVAYARSRDIARRIRVTHPSAALRQRGALQQTRGQRFARLGV